MYRHLFLKVRSCFSSTENLIDKKWQKSKRNARREKVRLTLIKGSCLCIFWGERKTPKKSSASAKTNNLHFSSRKNFALIWSGHMHWYESKEDNSFLIDIKWFPCFSHPQIVCELFSSHARHPGSSQIMSKGDWGLLKGQFDHTPFIICSHTVPGVPKQDVLDRAHPNTHAHTHTPKPAGVTDQSILKMTCVSVHWSKTRWHPYTQAGRLVCFFTPYLPHPPLFLSLPPSLGSLWPMTT